ncbi:MAG: glycerol dehydrogenase [Eubacteriales bacterium]|nr:glycerol dehydrogenase [Eubacteriales bacterium]
MVSSSRAFAGPMRYIQGQGEIFNLAHYASIYGSKAFVLIDAFLFDEINEKIEPRFEEDGIAYRSLCFSGECCTNEIERLNDELDAFQGDVVLGIGGGKTLDTAKMLSATNHLPIIIVPTSASTDAPTSALSVLYSDKGEYVKNVKHSRNADLIVMDSGIIVKAPLRLFVAGMGDALATYFEAEANRRSAHNNLVGTGYQMTKTAYAISELCYETLMQDGYSAKIAVENQVVTAALENVIEANTLMSGLGFENAGLSCAHGIHAGLTALPETHPYYHGEKVAFGVLCQLVLENADEKTLLEVMEFMYRINLPLTLKEIGVEPTQENISTIAFGTAVDNKLIQSEPFEVTEDLVFAAIKVANDIGTKYLAATRKQGVKNDTKR